MMFFNNKERFLLTIYTCTKHTIYPANFWGCSRYTPLNPFNSRKPTEIMPPDSQLTRHPSRQSTTHSTSSHVCFAHHPITQTQIPLLHWKSSNEKAAPSCHNDLVHERHAHPSSTKYCMRMSIGCLPCAPLS